MILCYKRMIKPIKFPTVIVPIIPNQITPFMFPFNRYSILIIISSSVINFRVCTINIYLSPIGYILLSSHPFNLPYPLKSVQEGSGSIRSSPVQCPVFKLYTKSTSRLFLRISLFSLRSHSLSIRGYLSHN